MPLHDPNPRPTPWRLTFPDEVAAAESMDRIAAEIETRAAGADDPGSFALLTSVNEALRELRTADASSADGAVQYAAFLFHAFHYHRAGAPTWLLDAPACRRLVGAEWEDPHGGRGPVAPAAAGYVQLPRHLFWVQGDPGRPAEAVDGLFWTVTEDRLHVLVVAGILEGRPGMSVVPLPAAPLADAPAWTVARMRPDGEDFATTLPGGELEALLSFANAGEVLKFLGRFFAQGGAPSEAEGGV